MLFSAIAQVSKHNQAKFRALSNMGDVLIKMNNHEEAIKVYQKQLALAKQSQDKVSEASAFGWLGVSHRLLKRFDKSLGFHTQVCRKNCKYVVIRVALLTCNNPLTANVPTRNVNNVSRNMLLMDYIEMGLL